MDSNRKIVKDGISVIMAINRWDEYCESAIKSIVNQSKKPDEIIIIANGPDSAKIISSIEKIDIPSLVLIDSELGQLAHSLNIGINIAKYNFIARMDSDDIAHPDRLEKQFDFMREKNLDIAGSHIRLINTKGERIGIRKYPLGEKIDQKLPFSSPFAHPSTMIRREFLIKIRGYNAGFNSEDYDLWLRAKRHSVRWDNINEFLLDYRINPAASQRRLLGYAECSGLALREFILDKSLNKFAAILVHILKSLVRPTSK
jgi:glycosyltransferase involved in cell wall biosynthesis